MMLAARGAFLAARRKPKLPYDAEVEYLESTGTQWIQTPVSVRTTQSSLIVDCRMRFTVQWNPTESDVAGSGQSNTPTMGRYGNRYYMWSRYSTGWTPVQCDLEWHNVSFEFLNPRGRRLTVDDMSYAPDISSNQAINVFNEGSEEYMYIFAAGRKRYPLYGAIARLSIMIDGRILFDAIPVRFTNEQGVSEGAMYDRVSGQLFRNSGTGVFTIGPDKTA